MGHRVLEYAGRKDVGRLLIDERSDGGVTITVSTRRGTLAQVTKSMSHELLALPFVPLVWLVYKLLATKKPRAVLRLTGDEFILSETSDDGLGYVVRSRAWARASITELRPNHYGNGLYLRVAGVENKDLLVDLPPDVIAKVGGAIATAQRRLARYNSPAPTQGTYEPPGLPRG